MPLTLPTAPQDGDLLVIGDRVDIFVDGRWETIPDDQVRRSFSLSAAVLHARVAELGAAIVAQLRRLIR